MLYQEGIRLLKESKFIDASLKFKELIARHPDSGLAPLAGILIGDSYLREGETKPAWFNDALEAYQEVRKGHPDGDVGAITLLRIGDAYQRLGFSYEATGSFKRIYSEFPGSRFIPKARVRAANAYLLSGRYQEALREAQAIIGSYPKSMEAADAFFMKGYTLNHMKRYGEAGKAYMEGSAKWPDYPRSNPVILYDMGDTYMRLGRYEMARQAFSALVNIYPKYNLSVKAMKNIGDSYRLEGKGSEAIKIYRETVDFFPEDESINGIKAILEEEEVFQSAINATKEKRIADAINAFNDLLIKYPKGIKTDETEKALAGLVKDYISDQFRSEGCLSASITYKKFKERVGAKIRDAGLYSLLGDCYMGLGLYNGAAEIYNEAIKMGGTGEETRYRIGEAGFLAGDYVNAGRHFEEFISSYPRSSRLVDAYRYLGISSYRSNDYKRSREAFARILEISKDSKHRVEGYSYIAGSYIADGSPDKASSAYKKLLDQLKDPDPGLLIRLGDALF
ncbi:MAG: tetratricopeptide repeat protein, partial [Nitrospirota bacterium]